MIAIDFGMFWLTLIWCLYLTGTNWRYLKFKPTRATELARKRNVNSRSKFDKLTRAEMYQTRALRNWVHLERLPKAAAAQAGAIDQRHANTPLLNLLVAGTDHDYDMIMITMFICRSS